MGDPRGGRRAKPADGVDDQLVLLGQPPVQDRLMVGDPVPQRTNLIERGACMLA